MTPREVVRASIFETTNHSPQYASDRQNVDRIADAALAALAQADGLAEVLAEALRSPVGISWADDPEAYRKAQGEHLADVVRAWLRGTP